MNLSEVIELLEKLKAKHGESMPCYIYQYPDDSFFPAEERLISYCAHDEIYADKSNQGIYFGLDASKYGQIC